MCCPAPRNALICSHAPPPTFSDAPETFLRADPTPGDGALTPAGAPTPLSAPPPWRLLHFGAGPDSPGAAFADAPFDRTVRTTPGFARSLVRAHTAIQYDAGYLATCVAKAGGLFLAVAGGDPTSQPTLEEIYATGSPYRVVGLLTLAARAVKRTSQPTPDGGTGVRFYLMDAASDRALLAPAVLARAVRDTCAVTSLAGLASATAKDRLGRLAAAGLLLSDGEGGEAALRAAGAPRWFTRSVASSLESRSEEGAKDRLSANLASLLLPRYSGANELTTGHEAALLVVTLLHVQTEYSGSGVGAALLGAAKATATAHNAWLFLESVFQLGAPTMYDKAGFRVMSVHRLHSPSGGGARGGGGGSGEVSGPAPPAPALVSRNPLWGAQFVRTDGLLPMLWRPPTTEAVCAGGGLGVHPSAPTVPNGAGAPVSRMLEYSAVVREELIAAGLLPPPPLSVSPSLGKSRGRPVPPRPTPAAHSGAGVPPRRPKRVRTEEEEVVELSGGEGGGVSAGSGSGGGGGPAAFATSLETMLRRELAELEREAEMETMYERVRVPLAAFPDLLARLPRPAPPSALGPDERAARVLGVRAALAAVRGLPPPLDLSLAPLGASHPG